MIKVVKDITSLLKETKQTFEGEYASIIYNLAKLYENGVPLGVTVVTKEKSFIDDDIGKVVRLTSDEGLSINLLSGKPSVVSEEIGFIIDNFFSNDNTYQNVLKGLLARNIIELLKITYQDSLTLHDVIHVLNNKTKLEKEVKKFRNSKQKDNHENIIQFFDREILNDTKEVQQAISSLVFELRMINRSTNKTNEIDIIKHFKEGGVLNIVTGSESIFNSPTISDVLAQFIILKIQNAILAKYHVPLNVPHFVFIENYEKYKNPDMDFITQNEILGYKSRQVSFNYTL